MGKMRIDPVSPLAAESSWLAGKGSKEYVPSESRAEVHTGSETVAEPAVTMREVRFRLVHDQVVIRIVDPLTGETVKEIPAAELVERLALIRERANLVLNAKA